MTQLDCLTNLSFFFGLKIVKGNVYDKGQQQQTQKALKRQRKEKGSCNIFTTPCFILISFCPVLDLWTYMTLYMYIICFYLPILKWVAYSNGIGSVKHLVFSLRVLGHQFTPCSTVFPTAPHTTSTSTQWMYVISASEGGGGAITPFYLWCLCANTHNWLLTKHKIKNGDWDRPKSCTPASINNYASR